MKFADMQPTKLFLHCAVPSMISMTVSAFYTIADGIFVGRFIGEGALAAVNLVMPLVMITFALSDMVAVGSSVQISMLLGQGRTEEAGRTFSSCLKGIAIFSIVVGVVGYFAAEPALLLMGAEPAVADMAEEYISFYALFAPLLLPGFALDNYLRVCGKNKYSMAISVLTALLNIVLDALFIVVLDMGIGAAALASCLSISLGTVLSFMPFLRKKLTLRLSSGWISFRRLTAILANGSSELFDNIASSLMMLLMNAVLLKSGGTAAIAAMSVVMYIDSIVGMVLFGLADSMQPAISYCNGAGLRRRVWILEGHVITATAVISLTALLIMRQAGDLFVQLFVQPENTALRELSLQAMQIFALSYLVGWIDLCAGSFLTAINKPGRSLLVSLCGTLVFPAATLIVMSSLFGLTGVWYSALISGIISAFVAVIAVASLKIRQL